MTTTARPVADVDLRAYVPRLLIDWGDRQQTKSWHAVDGTLVSADISGFTKLSERLAARGREGAEELTDLLNICFDGMIAAAGAEGGDVIKFGGDALLILFTGPDHAARACAATVGMRACIARPLVSRRGGRVQLRISQGVHSGTFHFFIVAAGHQELLVTGPAATATVECEATAAAGDILLSDKAAVLVDPSWLGESRPGGRLLRRRTFNDADVIDLGALEPEIDLRRGAGQSLGQFVAGQQQAEILAGSVGEHRQAVVGFVKFSGTDRLIEEAGPADVAVRLDRLAAQVQEAAKAHEVHWLASDVYPDGGKVILTAGAPFSTGHDEECMLRAVRQILDGDVGLTLRAGVNRGPVFAGNLGSQARRTFTVMGDAVNLAARLMQKAGPGELVASKAVLERSATQFRSEALAPFLVKGKSKPIEASVVGAIATGVSASSPDTGALPFVGRELEIAVLVDAWEAAGRGEGYAVEVVGEAGMGKSRLIAEFLRRVDPREVFVAACGQYARATPYYALRTALRRLVDIDPDADAGVAGEGLVAFVSTRAPALLEWLPLLAIPIGADVAATPQSERVAPEYRRAQMHRALVTLVSGALEHAGLLLVEDGHWLDDASRDFLVELGALGGALRWMVCLTRRPSEPVLEGTPNAVIVDVAPLPASATAELAAIAAEEHLGLSPEAVKALARKASGNPLFVLELVATAVAQGSVEMLPESIEASMTARIDALPPADRLLLRQASVAGAMVEADLLAEVIDDRQAADASRWQPLDSFVEWDNGQLRFRHALFRQVAYEGLSFRRRREAHGRFGQVLERRTGRRDLRRVAGLLSLHFHEADDGRRAWQYSLLAGDEARATYANLEAAAFYSRALADESGAGVSPSDVLPVAESLGDVNELLGQYKAADEAYALARRRASTSGAVGATARLLYKQGLLRERAGQYSQALRWFGRSGRAANAGGVEADGHDRVELANAYAGVHYRQGRYRTCIRWAERAAAMAEQTGDRRGLAHAYDLIDVSSLYGGVSNARPPGAALPIYEELKDLTGQSSVLNNLGIAAYQEGRWDDAVALYRRAQSAGEQAGDVNSAATALFNLGEILCDQGRHDEAARALTQARRVWRSIRYPVGVAVATLHLGRTAVAAGDLEAGPSLLDEALAQCRALNVASLVLEARVRRAEALVVSGDAEGALAEAVPLLSSFRDGTSDALLRVSLLRVAGAAYLAARRHEEAARALQESNARAQEARAPFEQARTLLVLARLAEANGDTDGGQRLREEAADILDRLGVVVPPPA